MSTPRSSCSGNIRPASMTMMSSPKRRAIMFMPNSPSPPSGMAHNEGCQSKRCSSVSFSLKLQVSSYHSGSGRSRCWANPDSPQRRRERREKLEAYHRGHRECAESTEKAKTNRGTRRLPSAHAACPAKSIVSLRGTLLFESDGLDDELAGLADMFDGAFAGAGSCRLPWRRCRAPC